MGKYVVGELYRLIKCYDFEDFPSELEALLELTVTNKVALY